MANRIITSAMLEDKEYLKHHGILGMKWGVRRTPEQLGHRTRSPKQTPKNNTNDENRKESATLALYTAALVLPMVFSVAVDKYSAGTADKLTEENKKLEISNLKDVKKIEPPDGPSQALSSVNKTLTVNTHYKNNCPNTTLGYEMRRRGFDVQAKPAMRGLTTPEILKVYNLKQPDLSIKGKTKVNEQIKEYFDKMPDGYRGAVINTWDGKLGGHIWNVEKINGKIMMFDAQSKRSAEFKSVSPIKVGVKQQLGVKINPADYLTKSSQIEFIRLDNAKINDAEMKKMIMKSGE